MKRSLLYASTPLAVAASITITALILAASASAPAGAIQQNADRAATPAQPADGASLRLRRIIEIRSTAVTPQGERGADEATFSMPSDTPGLKLTFMLALPEQQRLLSLEQPHDLIARDSTGADLSKIEKDPFSEEMEYLDTGFHFGGDEDAREITLRLLPATRNAVTFSVSASFVANTYSGTQPLEVDVGNQWTPLDAKVVGLEKVEVRASDQGLEIRPADANARIERVEIPVGSGEVIEGSGWFSDGQTLTYSFADDLPKQRPFKARFIVRTGVREIPLTIDVKEQPLP